MNIRYKLCPQQAVYDIIGYQWISNIMFRQTKNFRSKICNTDSYGLRFNSFDLKETIFQQSTSKDKAILIGGSTAFGVGATLDKNTIPGLLSQNSKYFFYNLGGRAFNGFQEIILFESLLDKIENVKRIVLVSGFNDVYMSFNKNFSSNYPGPLFFNKKFLNQMDSSDLSFNRKIIKNLIRSKEIDFRNIKKKDLIKYIFDSKFRKNYKLKSIEPKTDIKNIVKRNLKIWSLISKGLGIETFFFFSPFIDWCKDYCGEEEQLMNYAKNKGSLKYFKKAENNYEDIRAIFQKQCDEFGIKFYDCNQHIKSNSKKSDWLFVDSDHLNDNGYKIIGELIKDKI
tara:strand:+ start:8903 stop:9922 length:1020 start_codon:yes stop_codon:yes gene_type:complete